MGYPRYITVVRTDGTRRFILVEDQLLRKIVESVSQEIPPSGLRVFSVEIPTPNGVKRLEVLVGETLSLRNDI